MLSKKDFKLTAQRIRMAYEASKGGRIAEAIYLEGLADKAIFSASGDQEDILVHLQHLTDVTSKEVDSACRENQSLGYAKA